jgi:hypothetical protein
MPEVNRGVQNENHKATSIDEASARALARLPGHAAKAAIQNEQRKINTPVKRSEVVGPSV